MARALFETPSGTWALTRVMEATTPQPLTPAASEPRAPEPRAPESKTNLKALSREALEAFAVAQGQPRYRGAQLFNWIYGKGAASFEAMTSLPKAFRERLAEVAVLEGLRRVRLQEAADGTLKGLFALPSGRHVEAVLIPAVDETGQAQRLTVCVSSQVGCAMGCSFCATGLMGFQENLTPGAIFEQARAMNAEAEARYGRTVTNVVYMGMGEPLLNYDAVLASIDLLTHEKTLGLSPRRITVSTVGLAGRIRQLADDDSRVRLAVSLHAPTDAQRSAIMPVNRKQKTDLAALREAIEYYAATTGRQVTYEYCLFRGVNDAEEDARRLAEVTRWAPSKVNIIMYNPVAGLDFERSTEAQLERFLHVLVRQGAAVTVRRSRGQDIAAACGQLANEGGC